MQSNVDVKVVEGFGQQWSSFDQANLSDRDLNEMFNSYFHIFPWSTLPPDAEGFDAGCGTGRWAKLCAPRVGTIHCIDPSEAAVSVARRNLQGSPNCIFHVAGVANLPMADASMDFGYCVGVLHYIPDAQAGLTACVKKLKPGAPFLVYAYYAFDNRPTWFRTLWKCSDIGRRLLSKLPYPLRYGASQVIALTVYLPFARVAWLAARLGRKTGSYPLSYYRDRSFYVMRTDALDRFGTRIESRFTRSELEAMMTKAGLTNIQFSEVQPHWCATGVKA